MPSFDVVSRTELTEVDNAIQGAIREIETRYDFKGSHCTIDRSEETVVLHADDDMKLRQMQELLRGYLARRKVAVGAFDFQKAEVASGNTLRQNVLIKQGIERELAQKIVKTIKEGKLKVQVAIQGAELRVSGKKRDDLQEALALIRRQGFEQPLQYINFRD
ncbi:MAG: YajQ family cyclic di-GMP-binding protein [Alphaproteobacteria bacterium]|nr:YajQ family cyclic di-GMP-binding protein [Alphaproteobacteria bacterium]